MDNEIVFNSIKILVGDGDDQVAVYLNLDHVVDVIDDEDTRLIIHMSDGRTHLVSNDSEKAFRHFLEVTKLN